MKNKFLLLLFVVLSSCATKKDVFYFQDVAPELQKQSFSSIEINKGDVLDISISALNPEIVAVFQSSNPNQNMNSTEQRIIDGFLVDDSGFIHIPILGKLKALGETTFSLSRTIEQKLLPYVKTPTVKVQIVNFKVSVLGEVGSPQTFNLIEEYTTLPQLIALAGDLTINGDRTNILYLRYDGDKQIAHTIDLTKSDFINSPYFYVKPNDVIYVRPNTAKVKTYGMISNIGSLTGLISFLLSLTFLLTR